MAKSNASKITPSSPKALEEKTPIVQAYPTKCPKCGSIRRADYRGVTAQEFHGVQDGAVYTHIVRRWTTCLDCQQVRVDRSYENRTMN